MKKGNSLIEIIIAMAVFALILGAVSASVFGAEYLYQDAAISTEARTLAESSLATARVSLMTNFYTRVSTSSAGSFFSQSIVASDVDNFTKEIKSIVGWKTGSRNSSLEIDTLVTNTSEALGESDCNLNSSENWQNPQIYSGPDLGFGNQATGIFARDGYVYISANNANPRDKNADPNDFFIVDSRDVANAYILSKMDTGPGLSSIAVAGNYAYLGNTSINGQLEIVDITDLANPKLVKTFKFPGSYNDGTTIANAIFYHQGIIYLGTAKSQIEELHIINVENPLESFEIGKWEVNAAVNKIYVNNHYLYLATPNNQELAVLDISDPANPRMIGGFDAPGGSGNGKSLARDRNTLYLGRTVGKNELFALDISDPANVKNLGSKLISDSVNDLKVYFGKIFLVTNGQFEILDAASSSNMTILKMFALSAKGTGLSCSGKNIYASISSSQGFQIFSPS